MKKKLYSLILLLLPFFLPTIQAQDVAICGFDASGGTNTAGDEFSFVLLRDFAAGEIIYFTEDEYSVMISAFKADLGEGHLAYTVPTGGLLENEVVRIFENGANTFAVQCLSGATGTAVHLAATGTWSYSGSDELYAYSASVPASPWSSVTEIHCFYYGSVISPPVDQDPLPHYPNVIKLAVNLNAVGPMNANFMDAERMSTTLADLQNTANWTKSTSDITLSCTDFINHMLPVELLNFDAHKNEENVMLNWSTASEINNDYFQVEHSIDGKRFERMAQVNGVGNSTLINHYNFMHKNPVNGTNYYRLKQVDFNGRFEYSNTISVEFQKENYETSVFPNPFNESITLKIPLSGNNIFSSNALTIKVNDIYGRLMHTEQVSSNESIANLNLSNLNIGTYFLHVTDERQIVSTMRIVKY